MIFFTLNMSSAAPHIPMYHFHLLGFSLYRAIACFQNWILEGERTPWRHKTRNTPMTSARCFLGKAGDWAASGGIGGSVSRPRAFFVGRMARKHPNKRERQFER